MSDIPLKEHISMIFTEKEKALDLVAKSLEHRLEALNALRADVLKDRELFITKDAHRALEDRVDKLESWQARIVGAGIVLIALSGILGAIVTHLISQTKLPP